MLQGYVNHDALEFGDRDVEEWDSLFYPFPGRRQPPPSDDLCAAIENAHASARIAFALERSAAIAAAIAQGKHEISEDVRVGIIPADMLTSFADLHGHTDANDYAGINDEGVSPFVWQAANEIQTALDAWIKSGALMNHDQVAT